MSTTPRIPAELAQGFTMLSEGSDSPAAKIAIPIELTRLSGIPIASEGSVRLDAVVHECIRLFNAKYQGCEYCMNARAAIAVQSGLDESFVEQLSRFESSSLPEKIKAALRITSAIASAPKMVTPAVLEGARRFFSEQEISDIILLSVVTTGSKVAITLGVDPGKAASGRVFYPTDPVYGSSEDLKRAIEEYESKGFAVAGEVIPVRVTAPSA
jgi:AhpD family alkylhydroperoxidase